MSFYYNIQKTILLLSFLIIVLNNRTYSQVSTLVFDRITNKDGLSQSTVNYVIQDRNGFMWFATYGGINKYDGYKFTVYRHKKTDSTSISCDGVNSLFEDTKGYIWAVNNAKAGVDRLDPKIDKVIRYKNDPSDNLSISSNEIYHVMQDKLENIWICAGNGLNLVVDTMVDGQLVTTFKRFQNESISRFTYAYENKNGKLLLFSDYLYVFNRETNTFNNTNVKLVESEIISLVEDESGNILLGTFKEGIVILAYNASNSSYERKDAGKINVSPNNRTVLHLDNSERLWIGTEFDGLYRYDQATDQLIHYSNDEMDDKSLSSNTVYSLFTDHSNVLWIGTFARGLCKYDLYRKQFDHFKSVPGKANSLGGNVISSIHTIDSKELWVGHDIGGGISRIIFDKNKNPKIIHYKHDPDNNNTIADNSILALVQRKNGEVWAGDPNGSVSRIIPEQPEAGNQPIIKRYRIDQRTFELYEDNNGILWGGTWGGGLWRYNDDTEEFTTYMHVPNNSSSLCDDIVWAIGEDAYKNIWIGGHDRGLSILPASEKSKTNPRFINFEHKEDDSQSLSNNTIRAFCKDHTGTMWLATAGGLNKAVIDKNVLKNINDDSELKFQSYSTENGLPSEGIVGVVEDKNGNLWISTTNGISRFNVSDTTFTNYYESDGLQSNEFWHNAYFINAEGRIFFGGQNGFNAFYPDNIKTNPIKPEVVITDLKIFNQSVKISQKIENEIVISTPIYKTSSIELSYKSNMITFEFAALHYAFPSKNQYAYQMEGFDKDWIYNGNKRTATYTNLDPGKYVFKVKASNNDGLWNEKGTSIVLNILPPWWETWWFRILAGLGVIGLISGTYYYRLRLMKAQNLILEKTVKERTHEITEKNQMLQDVNVLIEEKQQEILTQNDELATQRNSLKELVNELELHRNNLAKLVEERTLKLKKAYKKVKESEALKSAFLANMSHEIRTPMNAIIGFSTLLNDEECTNEERANYIEIIQSNSNGLLKIIDEILDMSLIESDQLKIAEDVFELNVLIDHLYSYYYLSNTNHKITIKKNNELYNRNLKLSSDRVRVKQVLTNLMDNALKFTQEGFVELGVHIKDSKLCLYVKDSGKGIPPECINEIFKQFTKVEDKKSVWTSGIGLGLAISQSIANALGGKIITESALGKGSTFTLRMPVDTILTEKKLNIKEIKEPAMDRWQGKTIMIAEDVEANYIYLKRILQKTEAKVIWAKDGEEAIEMVLENSDIDLVLMDIKMPVIDGYEAAGKIKEYSPNLKIIAQTAYSRPEEKKKFFDKNFDDYISKPINSIDLIKVLEKFL